MSMAILWWISLVPYHTYTPISTRCTGFLERRERVNAYYYLVEIAPVMSPGDISSFSGNFDVHSIPTTTPYPTLESHVINLGSELTWSAVFSLGFGSKVWGSHTIVSSNFKLRPSNQNWTSSDTEQNNIQTIQRIIHVFSPKSTPVLVAVVSIF